MASDSNSCGGRVDDLPPASVEYYRYLEQDERILAAICTTEEGRAAHLRFAEHYHDLATRCSDPLAITRIGHGDQGQQQKPPGDKGKSKHSSLEEG